MSIKSRIKSWFISLLENTLFKLTNSDEEDSKYSSLSPSVHKTSDTPYYKSLKWAFENRVKEDIQNLAITGPYGSGKSTVIKSFESIYKNPDYKPLQISLASFGNEMANESEIEHTNGKDSEKKEKEKSKDKELTLRNIETSILQQIFFLEKDDKIPDSRFKKIRHRTKSWQFSIALGSIIFLFSLIFVLSSDSIYNMLGYPAANTINKSSIHYLCLFIVIAGAFYTFFKISRILWSISIEKFKIKNVKFTVGDKESKSILNHHLDEIIYFFSVRPYNVVIIEDLDRFQQTEIFIKLREVNQLLNKSKLLNGKHILFIYAVRDDMFKDVERTKFFDFVIPIIPIINSSNSGEKLRSWLKNQNIKSFSEEFIDGISFYIDDMRLLKNICNEFIIYSDIQDNNLNDEKLFALLTYKNKYPKDYVDLDRQKGELYKTFTSKSLLTEDKIVNINSEIEIAKDRVSFLNSQHKLSITNLRKLYIGHSYEKFNHFHSYEYKGVALTLNDLSTDEYWEIFRLNSMKFKQFQRGYQNPILKKIPFHFSDIESSVDADTTYKERSEALEAISQGEIGRLLKRTNELKKEKDNLLRLPLFELLNKHRDLRIPKTTLIDYSFLEFVLSSNYIGEDYSVYTSLFHGESLTRVDHQFLINVRQSKTANYNIKLSMVENVINKLSEFYFESPSILNVDILDSLLSNTAIYRKKVESLFIQLSKPSSLEFTREYREKGKHKDKFIKLLIQSNTDFFNQLHNSMSVPDDELELFISDTLSFSDHTLINKGSNGNFINEYIADHPQVLPFSSVQENAFNVISALNIKITKLDFSGYGTELKEFIYKGNHYNISLHNIKEIEDVFGNSNDHKFKEGTFSAINESGISSLIKYIENNLTDYINNVYVHLNDLTNDNEEDIITMLKHRDVSESMEHAILNKWDGKLSNVTHTDITVIPTYLLKNNKVKASWSNIFKSIDDQLDPKALTDFLNLEDNHSQLAQLKASSTIVDKYLDAITVLLDLNKLTTQSTCDLVKGLGHYDFENKLKDLSESWISALISEKILDPKIEIFETLSARGDSTHVELFLSNHEEMKDLEVDVYFNEYDINSLMTSQVLSDLNKAQRISNIADHSKIVTHTPAAKAVSEVMLRISPILTNRKLSYELMLNSKISITEKISLFKHFVHNTKNISIIDFLSKLGEPYAAIANSSRRADLPISNINQILLEKLKNLSYISSFSKKSRILGEPYFRVNLKFKK